jgi:hypothetical protein
MKTSPVSKASPEKTMFEQQLDSPLSRIMSIVTPPPTERTDPWSIEQQCQRDIQIVSMILRRYCQHRDKLELRGNRTVGLGELCDAMLDRADLCALFSSEQRGRDCDCGCERDEECQKFNQALK